MLGILQYPILGLAYHWELQNACTVWFTSALFQLLILTATMLLRDYRKCRYVMYAALMSFTCIMPIVDSLNGFFHPSLRRSPWRRARVELFHILLSFVLQAICFKQVSVSSLLLHLPGVLGYLIVLVHHGQAPHLIMVLPTWYTDDLQDVSIHLIPLLTVIICCLATCWWKQLHLPKLSTVALPPVPAQPPLSIIPNHSYADDATNGCDVQAQLYGVSVNSQQQPELPRATDQGEPREAIPKEDFASNDIEQPANPSDAHMPIEAAAYQVEAGTEGMPVPGQVEHSSAPDAAAAPSHGIEVEPNEVDQAIPDDMYHVLAIAGPGTGRQDSFAASTSNPVPVARRPAEADREFRAFSFRQIQTMIDHEQGEMDIACGRDTGPAMRIISRRKRQILKQELLGVYLLCRCRILHVAQTPKEVWQLIAAFLAPSRAAAAFALGSEAAVDDDRQSFASTGSVTNVWQRLIEIMRRST